MAWLVLVSLCLALLSPAYGQIVPADMSPLSGYCSVSPEELRVLPSSGFARSDLTSFEDTNFTAGPDTTVSNLADCQFQSFDPSFDLLIGTNRTFYRVGPAAGYQNGRMWAVESPAYLPDTDEIIFSSYQLDPPQQLFRLSLSTGTVTEVPMAPGSLGGTGGMAYYGNGQVALCTAGDRNDEANPPSVLLLDPYLGNSTVLVNNWFGQRFNGFDDIQTLSDGTLLLTDTNYSSMPQNLPPFSIPAALPNDVWVIPTGTGTPRPLVRDIPSNPNGIAVSPDETTLYITVGALTAAMDPLAAGIVNSVYAYDLVQSGGGWFAQNKRVHAVSDYGYYDGTRVDKYGNIFGCADDGIHVISPGGSIIGKIQIPPIAPIALHPSNSIGFAGDRLLILRNKDVLMLPLNTSGAGLDVNSA